jgi:hypothetical protein
MSCVVDMVGAGGGGRIDSWLLLCMLTTVGTGKGEDSVAVIEKPSGTIFFWEGRASMRRRLIKISVMTMFLIGFTSPSVRAQDPDGLKGING